MTLLGRLFKFECDKCHVVVYVNGYGLPDGWKWYPIGVQGVGHKCEECIKEEKLVGKDDSKY